MAFPSVIVECAFRNVLDESKYAPMGFTDITDWVESLSGKLRGRGYELGRAESGAVQLGLDNADQRFSPVTAVSPYAPYVRANRRLRIRGKNMLPLNVARGGGQDHSTMDFLPDYINANPNVLATHDPVALGLTGDLGLETFHIEGTVPAGTAAYRNTHAWFVPAETGVRLTHSAWVWKVAGTEPTGTPVAFSIYHLDYLGNVTGQAGYALPTPTPTMPTRVTLTSLPPVGTAYSFVQISVDCSTHVPVTDLTYAVTGAQSELPPNLAPNISALVDTNGWTFAGTGTLTRFATTTPSLAYVACLPVTGDTELRTVIPHLVPGRTYTAYAQVIGTASCPSIRMSADDGLTGPIESTPSVWTTLATTFVAKEPEQAIKFIPLTPFATGNNLQVRQVRVVEGLTGALAADGFSPEPSTWERPKPIFDGWVEQWPITLTAASSTVTINVTDRLKKLGEVELGAVLREELKSEPGSVLIIPCSDSPVNSSGLTAEGPWADMSGASVITPTATRNALGIGTATYALGMAGPTDETALALNRFTATQGYFLSVPHSTDFSAPPAPTMPPPQSTFTAIYGATWSQSYNGSNNQRSGVHIWQGDASDGNGDQRSLVGFNLAAIRADLTGAAILYVGLNLFARWWWYDNGGTGWIGSHGYTSAPGSINPAFHWARRWDIAGWRRNQWRTALLPLSFVQEIITGGTRGISVGWGGSGYNHNYGYYSGATESDRPYLQIVYRR